MAGDPDTAEQTPVEPSPRTGDDGRLDGITGIAGLPVVPDDVPDEGLGIEVSGVRLVRLLGEGGMGRVYEGVQAQPRRTVAVKLLRAGLVSNAMLRRFEIEADALGRLRHPGVAAVYAAGGRPVPHLVMEFVAGGLPITSHAAAHRLGIRDRVALMAAVSDAVAHGHQRGVIHRDLKPSNILVEPTGQPKVIDFGIARIVDPQADPAAESETTTGQLLGTAAYMAPEQFTGPADAVDVRTDVHALGVVLYELVTGRPPWILPAGNPLEAARIICQDVPSPPSRLVAGLPRPLDAITASCLAKDRADRYPTAAELAADLRRFLAGEPVVAAPPRALDAVRRFAARHRPVAAAIAATFMMLLVGSGVISWLAVDAARQRVRAEQRAAEADLARASADEQRRRAEQALEVVAGTFRLWDPGTDGRAVTAARVVSRAVENAIDRFEGDADTKARVLFALGRGAIAVEEYPAAVRALTACAALPRDRAALEPTRGAVLANLAQAMQLGGDPTQAARTFERAIEELRFSMGPDHDDTLLTICNLASLRRQLGDAEGSITLLRPALEQVESRFGRDDPQVLSLRTNLALALVDRGRLGEAVDEFRAVLDGRLRVLGADHSDTTRAHRNLGGCLARLERFAEAAESLSTAHAGLLRVYGHDHREVILCEYDLAISLEAAGEVNRAIPLYKRVLAAVRGRNGADSAQAREVETRLRAAEQTAEKDD